MKSLLLTVTLFVLVAVLQAQDDLPFLSEEKKLSGVWFVKAIVNERNLTELGRPLVLFPYTLSCLEQGILEVKTTVMYEGQCMKTTMHMQRTEKPGQYSSFSGHKLFYIYELPVKDHYIIYIETLLHEKKFLSGHLIGKCPKENMEALEEFKKFTQHKGLLQENIIVPQQRERCVPNHGRGLAALDGADIARHCVFYLEVSAKEHQIPTATTSSPMMVIDLAVKDGQEGCGQCNLWP
ncbi:vomeronasal secretory protein 2-like [Peromyscus eremicus]|uniref:vomeronasal secretory protein 2-like n=1 Tax=Peromyscus eremicus TaxID=42410 RepID=UPI0027DD7AFF|nr:vomeronasal secretory protein 2-like [Peromyscus eremicus]